MTGTEVIGKMKEHYVSYGNDMKDKFLHIFGNLTNATASGD